MFDAEPDGWEQTTVGAVLSNFAGGGTPAREVAAYWNGEIPWASVKDITSGADLPQEWVTAEGVANSASRVVPAGTNILAMRMAVGTVARFRRDVAINQDLAALFPNERLDSDFLFQWLDANSERLKAVATGTTVKGLRKDVLLQWPLLLPPLDEQRRIAEVLRSVDEAISAIGEIERHLRATSASLIEELVLHGTKGGAKRATGIGDVPMGWDVVRLSDLLTIKHGFPFSSEFFSRETGDTILLTPGNFSTNKTLYFGPNTKFYNGPIPNGFVLSDGDLLVVMTDLTQDMAILGNAVRLRSDRRVLHNQRIGKAEPVDPRRIDSGYARLLLNSTRVQNAVKSTASGTTVRHTSPSKILEVLVALPSLGEQVEIAKIAYEIEAACDQSVVADDRSLRSETLTQLISVKAAIASDLLTGRVRVPA